ncbi:hypothetical protein M3Y94_00463900 [Aphelenchoides besseyi]|nr:hypothetical protein M3Y94_00463900 [Aphelenchoides besseyi]
MTKKTMYADIERLFLEHGPIRQIIKREDYAFVVLANAQAAREAIRDVNGELLHGQRVTVEQARPPRFHNRRNKRSNFERRPSCERSYSRSRSRSPNRRPRSPNDYSPPLKRSNLNIAVKKEEISP